MKHEADFERRALPRPTQAEIAEAKAGYASGHGVNHNVVGPWLLTWGTPEFKDFPAWLDEQDG